jgi:hypothetical protein
MTPRSKLISLVFGVIILAVLAAAFAGPDGPAPDAPDRNVPGATTGPGSNTVQ